MPKLVIHGGLGSQFDLTLDKKTEIAYHHALASALDLGYSILNTGGNSLDAVTAAVVALEDCPLFNAGTGSVLNRDGQLEMDAAIMDGSNLQAGAVAGLSQIKNPVICAKLIMTHSPHVMLVGKHAEAFSQSQGISLVDTDSLVTAQKLQAWHNTKGKPSPSKLGTVGAVALDQAGNLAAATSTGGLMHKLPGRVSDSCIIGAGTFADNTSCAVSCTGEGEYFIRNSAAKEVACKVRYQGLALKDAVQQSLQLITDLGGQGGIIAIDSLGNTALLFNGHHMYRGLRDETKTLTWIYK